MTTDTQTFILGIHHFCDHRCWRCEMKDRCAVAARLAEAGGLDMASPRAPASRVAAVIGASLQVTMEEMTTMIAAFGLDDRQRPVDAGPHLCMPEVERSSSRAEQDPLVVRGGEYASTSWRILKALRPRLTDRGDRAAIEAADRLEETCMTIASKVFRAVSSSLTEGHDASDVQNDANGSAKVALLLIEESRRDWRVLMETGRAAANGVPARLVLMLDSLERDLGRRFPRALEFVRPGFDTLADGAGPQQLAQAILRAGSSRSGAPS